MKSPISRNSILLLCALTVISDGQASAQDADKNPWMAEVAKAAADGRCDEAKTIALRNGSLDVAERALKLCAPSKLAPVHAVSAPAQVSSTTKVESVPAQSPSKPIAAIPTITNPDWRRRPTELEIGKYYPKAAKKQKLGGQAIVSCIVNTLGLLENCIVVAESPLGLGFGDAALKIASFVEMTPKLVNGVAIQGGTVRIPLKFSVPGGTLPPPLIFLPPSKALQTMAESGDAMAQNTLGFMFANGQGVPQDYAAAVGWYQKAADKGNALAQNTLGNMFANGQGVPQDYATAVGWYRKAADQGNALARNNLRFLCALQPNIKSCSDP